MKSYSSIFVIATLFSITALFITNTSNELKYLTDNDPPIVNPPIKILFPKLKPNKSVIEFIPASNSISV